jgi:hypothetical protein
MIEQVLIILFLAAYLVPQIAPDRRWLVWIAALMGAAVLVAWFGWVGAQTSSIGAGVAGLIVMVGAATAGMGVLVRAVVLWRNWDGGRMILATAGGFGLLLAGLFLIIALS